MKTIALWIIGCLALTAMGCSERTDKRTELPLNSIDTAKLKPELKAVVRAYIKAHPRYKTFLMVQGKVQEEEWFDYKTPYYFCIGPALDQLFDGGEFTLSTSYPTSYFLLNDDIILVKTLQEEFIVPDKAVIDTYSRLAEPLDTFEKGTTLSYTSPATNYITKSWVIRIGREIPTKVVSTRADTFLGRKRVEWTPPLTCVKRTECKPTRTSK